MTDQRPDTWRANPTKTFVVGVAIGLIPPTLAAVVFVLMVLLPVPGCTP